jgi:hypothetical protein
MFGFGFRLVGVQGLNLKACQPPDRLSADCFVNLSDNYLVKIVFVAPITAFPLCCDVGDDVIEGLYAVVIFAV